MAHANHQAPRSLRVHGILRGLREGSTRPLPVETDDGRFVCKLVNGPDGPRALAAEWVGAALAAPIGIAVPEISLLELDASIADTIAEDELREAVARGAGTCLGLRELPGAHAATAEWQYAFRKRSRRSTRADPRPAVR